MKKVLLGWAMLVATAAPACRNEPARLSSSETAPTIASADTIAPLTDTLERAVDTTEPLGRIGTLGESIKDVKSGAGAGMKSVAPSPVGKPGRDNDDPAAEGFADVAALDPSIRLDIRYATAENFTKRKIYDCPRCLMRPAAAQALVRAHQELQKRGLGLKVYDCYRPRPYQQRLWDAVPDPNYVTPPARGSMHSRGAAVDLTIVDAQGKELDMGTPYDFFGREAHTDYLQHPEAVLANRRLLKQTLEAAGFGGIRTEWWHFSYRAGNFPLSSYVWKCQ